MGMNRNNTSLRARRAALGALAFGALGHASKAFAIGDFVAIRPGETQAPQVPAGEFSSASPPLSFSARQDPPVSLTNSVASSFRPGVGPSVPNWPKPGDVRQIWLKRPVTGEEVVARYCENGRLNMDEYLKACRLLRDVRANVTAYIDVEMLDLVFAMQKWLVMWGIDKPIIVQSGFRSQITNDRTEGAAKNSMHVHGRAIDIRMPGVGVSYLGRLASIFGVGGVGFYVSKNFVHADTGRIRYWRS